MTPIHSQIITQQHTVSQITQTKRRIGITQFLMYNSHGRGVDKACAAVLFRNGEAQYAQIGSELAEEGVVECFGAVVFDCLWFDLARMECRVQVRVWY